MPRSSWAVKTSEYASFDARRPDAALSPRVNGTVIYRDCYLSHRSHTLPSSSSRLQATSRLAPVASSAKRPSPTIDAVADGRVILPREVVRAETRLSSLESTDRRRRVRKVVGAATLDPALLTDAERIQYEGCLHREEADAAIRALSGVGVPIP